MQNLQTVLNESLSKKEVFSLNPNRLVGSYLTLADSNNTANKSQTSHCAVLGNTSFSKGVHTWSVSLKERKNWCGEYWLMIGVHSKPTDLKDHPSGDNGVYGVSVSNNMNGWITRAGSTEYKALRKVNPGDIVSISLDCDNGKLDFKHKDWIEQIEVPKLTELTPYFDPYDLDFSLAF